MVFGYTLQEAKKAVVAFVLSAVVLVGFFIAVPMEFQTMLPIIIGQLFGVAAVFLTKNHTADDLSKAVQQLAGSVFSLVAVFTQVSPDTVESVALVIAQLTIVYAVYQARNHDVNMRSPVT